AVLEVLSRHAGVRLRYIADSVRKSLGVLGLRPQQVVVEDLLRIVKDPSEETADELCVDPPTQPARRDRPAVVLVVFQRLEQPLLDQKLRVTLLAAQPAPDLGYQQADVVSDVHLRPYIS